MRVPVKVLALGCEGSRGVVDVRVVNDVLRYRCVSWFPELAGEEKIFEVERAVIGHCHAINTEVGSVTVA